LTEKEIHIDTQRGKLPVMEAFYTIQGEGIHCGKAAYFVRLAGCDVGCVWCDVKESWSVSDTQYRSIVEIVSEASNHSSRIAVITGGEPCMYNLSQLIDAFHLKGFRVHLETSGAYPVQGKADWICVSPKKFKEPVRDVLKIANELKVIVFHESDLKWANELSEYVSSTCSLLLQPEYEKSNKMLPLIVNYCKEDPRWRISLQTHKYIGIP